MCINQFYFLNFRHFNINGIRIGGYLLNAKITSTIYDKEKLYMNNSHFRGVSVATFGVNNIAFYMCCFFVLSGPLDTGICLSVVNY